MINQHDFVFFNIPFKGLDKENGVRYALSANEILLEVRDSQNKINRMCQTLDKAILIEKSDVSLLVDFICIKLAKSDASETWNSTGYDISNFTIPPDGSAIISNFLK